MCSAVSNDALSSTNSSAEHASESEILLLSSIPRSCSDTSFLRILEIKLGLEIGQRVLLRDQDSISSAAVEHKTFQNVWYTSRRR